MTDIHDEMIREREIKKEKLQAQLDALSAEIKALREAKRFMLLGEIPNKSKKVNKTRERALATKWTKVLRAIGENGESALDGLIYEIADDMGISRDSMRGQMAYYEKKGLLERVASGVYRLTEEGAVKCGYSDSSDVSDKVQKQEDDDFDYIPF